MSTTRPLVNLKAKWRGNYSEVSLHHFLNFIVTKAKEKLTESFYVKLRTPHRSVHIGFQPQALKYYLVDSNGSPISMEQSSNQAFSLVDKLKLVFEKEFKQNKTGTDSDEGINDHSSVFLTVIPKAVKDHVEPVQNFFDSIQRELEQFKGLQMTKQKHFEDDNIDADNFVRAGVRHDSSLFVELFANDFFATLKENNRNAIIKSIKSRWDKLIYKVALSGQIDLLKKLLQLCPDVRISRSYFDKIFLECNLDIINTLFVHYSQGEQNARYRDNMLYFMLHALLWRADDNKENCNKIEWAINKVCDGLNNANIIVNVFDCIHSAIMFNKLMPLKFLLITFEKYATPGQREEFLGLCLSYAKKLQRTKYIEILEQHLSSLRRFSLPAPSVSVELKSDLSDIEPVVLKSKRSQSEPQVSTNYSLSVLSKFAEVRDRSRDSRQSEISRIDSVDQGEMKI